MRCVHVVLVVWMVVGCAAAGVEGAPPCADHVLAHLSLPDGNHTLVPCEEWLSSTASAHDAPLRDVLTDAHARAGGLSEGRPGFLIWVEKLDESYERHRIAPLLRTLAMHGECAVLRLAAVRPSSVFTPRRDDGRAVVEAGDVAMVVWGDAGVRVEVVPAAWYHALSLVRMFEVLTGRLARLWPCAAGDALDTPAPVGDVVRTLSRTHMVDAERVCVHEEVWEDADGPLRVHTVEWLPRADTLAVEHVPLRVGAATRTVAVLRGHALAHVPAVPVEWAAPRVFPKTPWRELLHVGEAAVVPLAEQQVEVMRRSGVSFLASLRVAAEADEWEGKERPSWATLACESLLTTDPPMPHGEDPKKVFRFFHASGRGQPVRVAHNVGTSHSPTAPAACVRAGRFDLRELTSTRARRRWPNNLMRLLRGECVRCHEQPPGIVREGGIVVEWPQWQPHMWDDLRIAHLELFLRGLLELGRGVPVHVHVREAGDGLEPAVRVRWEGYEAEVALHASVEASTRGPTSAMQMAEWFWAHRALVQGTDAAKSTMAWRDAHMRVCRAIAGRASNGLRTALPAGANGREALLLAMAEQTVSLNATGCVEPPFSWYPTDAPAGVARRGFDDSVLALRGAAFVRWAEWTQGHTLPTLRVDELHEEAGAVAMVIVPGTAFDARASLWSDLLAFVPADALFVLPRAHAAALPARAGIRPQRRPLALLVDRHRFRTLAQPLAPGVMERCRSAQEVLEQVRMRVGAGGERVTANPLQLVHHWREWGEEEHVSRVLTVGEFRRCQDRPLAMTAQLPRLPLNAIDTIPRGFLVWVSPLVRGDAEREWVAMDVATALSDAMDRRGVLVWYGSPANVSAWPRELQPAARALTHWAAAHGGQAVLLPILDGRVVPLPLAPDVHTAMCVHTLRLPAHDTVVREWALVRGTGTLASELAHRVWLLAHGHAEQAAAPLSRTHVPAQHVAPPRGELARWAVEHAAEPLAERNSTFVRYHTRGALPMRVQREAIKTAPATLVQEYTAWSGHAKRRWEHMRPCLPEHTPDRMHVAWRTVANDTRTFDIPALLHTNGEALPRSPACAAMMYVCLYPSAPPSFLYGAGSGRVALYTPPPARDTLLPRAMLRALARKCNGTDSSGGGRVEPVEPVEPAVWHVAERREQDRFFANLPFSVPLWLEDEDYPEWFF